MFVCIYRHVLFRVTVLICATVPLDGFDQMNLAFERMSKNWHYYGYSLKIPKFKIHLHFDTFSTKWWRNKSWWYQQKISVWLMNILYINKQRWVQMLNQLQLHRSAHMHIEWPNYHPLRIKPVYNMFCRHHMMIHMILFCFSL